jgi:hypothetical protein
MSRSVYFLKDVGVLIGTAIRLRLRLRMIALNIDRQRSSLQKAAATR